MVSKIKEKSAGRSTLAILAALLLAAGVAAVIVSCSDSSPGTTADGSTKKDVAVGQDGNITPKPDSTVDSFFWPDGTITSDAWPQDQGYTGSTFGCKDDSDCFGQKCCATPWGVRLCADACQ